MIDRSISVARGLYVMHLANAQGHYTMNGMRIFALKIARTTSTDFEIVKTWARSAMVGMGIVALGKDVGVIEEARKMVESFSGTFLTDLDKTREEYEMYISHVRNSSAYVLLGQLIARKQKHRS